MKVYVFRATRLGWGNKVDGIWFAVDDYTLEEAEAEFQPVQGETVKANGVSYPYTAYEYDGVVYHDYTYLGIYDYDNMPGNY